MAALRLVDQISSELDKGNITVGIFIDISKAFDTIDHVCHASYHENSWNSQNASGLFHV